jgi:hypothetical protein
MVANSSKVKEMVKIRLQQDNIKSVSMESGYDFHIQTACLEIAGTTYFRDLLKTIYGSCGTDGTFTVQSSVVPYQYYYGGEIDEDNSWIRSTPVDYDYFERANSGYMYSPMSPTAYGYNSGYTIIPSENHDYTVLKFINLRNVYSTKLIYYPIAPDCDDFPTYFIPLIVNKVIEKIAIDSKSESKDRYIQQLRDETAKLSKIIQSRANKIEKNLSTTIRNMKQKRWLVADPYDLFFWRPA